MGLVCVVGLEDEAFAEGVDNHYAMHQQRGAYVGIALYGDAMYFAEFEIAPFQPLKVQQRYCVFAFNAEMSDDVTAVFRPLYLPANVGSTLLESCPTIREQNAAQPVR